MDAAKLQLFIDWENKNRDRLISSRKSTTDLSVEEFIRTLPYNINEAKVSVEVKTSRVEGTTDKVLLFVKDNGTGISKQKLKKLKHVGNIYDPEAERVKKQMPEWLKPTGAFGIGLQSVFQVMGEFKMHTYSTITNECLEIIFNSTETDGEIFRLKSDRLSNHGTEVEVNLRDIKMLYEENPEYIRIDRFLDDADAISPLIKRYLERTICPDFIPMQFRVSIDDSYPKDDTPDNISSSIFEKAFPSEFRNVALGDKNAKFDWRIDLSDDQFVIWQWSMNKGVIVRADIGSVADNLSQSLSRNNLKGKARLIVKGIRVQPGNEHNLDPNWEKKETSWCNSEFHIFSADVEKILSISREKLKQPFSKEERKHRDAVLAGAYETLLLAFENLLTGYYHWLVKDDKASNDEIWKEFSYQLSRKKPLPLIVCLAADCLKKRSMAVSIEKGKPEKSKVVIDSSMAAMMEYVIKEVCKRKKVEVNAYVLYRAQRRVTDMMPVHISELFENIDNTWFTEDYCISMSSSSQYAESEWVFDDVLLSYPIPLYWSEIMYLKGDYFEIDGKRIPYIVPVYKYCAAARKSILLQEDDIRFLFGCSYYYGLKCGQKNIEGTDQRPDVVESDEKALGVLMNTYGARHVFPPISGFEKIAVPYDENNCPSICKRYGYVILSPFSNAAFSCDRENNTSIVKEILGMVSTNNSSIDELKDRIIALMSAGSEDSDDKYGFRKVIEYVKEKNDLKGDECEEEYVNFVIYYSKKVLEYISSRGDVL